MMRFLKRPREEEQPSTSATATNDGASATATNDGASKVARPEPPPQSEAVTALLGHLTEPGWLAALRREFGKSYFAELANKIAAERKTKSIFPPEQYAPLEHRAVSFPSSPKFLPIDSRPSQTRLFCLQPDPTRCSTCRDSRSGPIPRPWPGTRSCVFGQPRRRGATKSQEHIHGVRAGREGLPAPCARQPRELGAAWRHDGERDPYCASGRSQLAPSVWLADIHRCRNSRAEFERDSICLHPLGRFCTEKMHHDQPQPALRHRNGAPVASQRNQVPRLPVLLRS